MAEAVDATPTPPKRSRHAPRFALLTGALIGIAIGAVALAAVLIGNGSNEDPAWSIWRPNGSGIDAAQEIADHVAPNYRLTGGGQAVLVTGGPLELAKVPVHLATHSLETDTYAVVTGDTVLYTFCGAGTKCSIKEGKPSAERLLLLRREALELALYTFRYLDDVDNVVALMPPNPDKVTTIKTRTTKKTVAGKVTKSSDTQHEPETTALLLRRDQLAGALDAPLRATLPALTPTVETMASAPEAQRVDLVTAPGLYLVNGIQRGQDATAFLVLDGS